MPYTRRQATGRTADEPATSTHPSRPTQKRPGPSHRPTHRDPVVLTAPAVYRLIAAFTRPGGLVADLDATPVVTAAADQLGRRFTTNPHRYHGPGGSTPCAADLLFTHLPRPHAATLSEAAEWMRTCRMLLRPAGHLVAVVHVCPDDAVNHATTVATAASAAGLAAVPPTWRASGDPDGIFVFTAAGGRRG